MIAYCLPVPVLQNCTTKHKSGSPVYRENEKPVMSIYNTTNRKFHKDLEQRKRGHTACTDRKLYLSRLPCASDRRDFTTNSIRFISDSTLSFFQLWKSIRISGQPSNNCLTHTFSKGSWSYRKYKPIFQWVILCGLRRTMIHVKIHWEL